MTIENLATHPKAFVSPEELAAYLDVPRGTVYHWIDKGALAARKIGGLLRIPTETARAFESKPARTFSE